ncbi:MAG: hypothetical protein WCA46_08470, partial [Actinocatenispora sp.]
VRTRPLRTILAADGRVAVASADRRLVTVDPSGAVRSVALPGDPLALTGTPGRATALLALGGGRYRIARYPGAQVVAEGAVPAPVLAAGTLAPDGASAYLTGGDHQVWWLARGVPARGLGIPAADRDTVLTALPGGRLVVGGDADRTHVYLARSGLDLGVVCRELPRLFRVEASPDGATLGCLASTAGALWPAPAAPDPAPRLAAESASVRHAAGSTLDTDGNRVRFHAHDAAGRELVTPWIRVFAEDVTAVAVSPDHRQVALGSRTGQVVVESLTPPRVYRLVTVRLPATSPVTALTWRGGTLSAVDDAGRWRVPTCAGCDTNAGALRAVLSRLTDAGCWNPTQIASVDSDTRRRIGAHLCAGLPPITR